MKKDKILVVEDELAIRKLIQFNLTRSNRERCSLLFTSRKSSAAH